MKLSDKDGIRNAIVGLHANGRGHEAWQIWDLLDAYLELDVELEFKNVRPSTMFPSTPRSDPDQGKIVGPIWGSGLLPHLPPLKSYRNTE